MPRPEFSSEAAPGAAVSFLSCQFIDVASAARDISDALAHSSPLIAAPHEAQSPTLLTTSSVHCAQTSMGDEYIDFVRTAEIDGAFYVFRTGTFALTLIQTVAMLAKPATVSKAPVLSSRVSKAAAYTHLHCRMPRIQLTPWLKEWILIRQAAYYAQTFADAVEFPDGTWLEVSSAEQGYLLVATS
ncbi:uncharacterized protein SCHCODRAFT_02710300 [Schizophyllum commune H4-8]|nr:uncharacterized protein SCHCODRAFT_02710300 [Schizophyllum commune H4-8]KAI5900339.1 hypothetical protein SCHCODRAFT_02710300 [Schizophyllum commune H4-8]